MNALLRERSMDSAIGRLTLRANGEGLTHIFFEGTAPSRPDDAIADVDVTAGSDVEKYLDQTERELREYFDGTRTEFTVKLAPRGTDFQRQVWRALLEVPHGATCSYGEIASKIARPKAVRAVGAANGANPIPIIIPCHRIVGGNRRLTGYAGGLELKRQLLALEGVQCSKDRLIDSSQTELEWEARP
jgi:methylated-DNA-[protein]-cysteine S-methyltransferase